MLLFWNVEKENSWKCSQKHNNFCWPCFTANFLKSNLKHKRKTKHNTQRGRVEDSNSHAVFFRLLSSLKSLLDHFSRHRGGDSALRFKEWIYTYTFHREHAKKGHTALYSEPPPPSLLTGHSVLYPLKKLCGLFSFQLK